MNTQLCAVLTNVQSTENWYPIWRRYYGREFGGENLYLSVQKQHEGQFSTINSSNLFVVENGFEDLRRSQEVAVFVKKLLERYKYVIHIDTDEFLVPDPRKHRSLRDYVATLGAAYVTARGFDVIEHKSEAALRSDELILVEQRSFAYPNSALNKTCIVSEPITWGRGFHFCTRSPSFDSLFLFHMKYASIDALLKWNAYMSEQGLATDSLREYYRPDPQKIRGYIANVSTRRLVDEPEGVYRDAFNSEYLSWIERNDQNGIFYGKTAHEHVLVKIPSYFRGCL